MSASTTSIPTTGERFRLTRDVDRYPHFIAPAGAEGEVAWVSDETIALRLDEPLAGAEHWDNEVCWSAAMRADYVADFAADCERI